MMKLEDCLKQNFNRGQKEGIGVQQYNASILSRALYATPYHHQYN
jgi:hypothetical protein